MTTPTFAELGIVEPLCRALSAEGYETPTPIQARTIPALLQGHDVLGLAQTGTGKTAAFALPILQKLLAGEGRRNPRTVKALILAPTRELAIQIEESLVAYGRHTHLRHTVIFGGVNQFRQVKALAPGVDVLVATPGRLLDLINQRHVTLAETTTLVLDEADRMLDMGFSRDVKKIIATMPKKGRHSLLFSATMPASIEALAAEILNNPTRVEVTPEVVTVDKIEQHVLFVDQKRKRELLAKLLENADLSRVIIFTRTKHCANRVSEQLEKSGVPSEAIHGNKSQGARQRALEAFRSGEARVLVATDIAARGIDVDGITHVINYELPNEPESYVHRIGRTARAGASGIALSFCDGSERSHLKAIERLTRRTLAVYDTRPLIGDTPSAAFANEPAREDRRPNNNRPKQGQRNGKPQGQRNNGPRTGHGDARSESGRPEAISRNRPGSRARARTNTGAAR
ncbi:MAG: DEAD/DEAH box helicase [Parvibaculum sp.]|uniref:DEAD/DEAH box helicase n=1 Tax=Parvibaculum sp. TaxID=2024848 RepID=UPI003C735BAC